MLGGDGTMLRALQGFLGTGIPVLGVNFGRVGFLSSIAREELEEGVRRVFAGELEVMELATLDVEAGGQTVRRRQRRGRLERHARPHGRDRVVDRGPGLRPRSLRRAHLLDAVGLDGLQPLQRRAGADVGARRDGAHLRRPARPSRAPVRRAARATTSRSGTGPRTSAAPSSSTAITLRTPGRGRRYRSGSASSARCSARCRTRPSCAAIGRASARG